MIDIKLLRRGIIAVCILILMTNLIYDIPEGKYYEDELKELVKDGKAQVIEINKKAKLGGDTFIAKRLITTHDETYLRYSVVRWEMGWSFPAGAIEIIDDKDRHYDGLGGGSSGKTWGQEGLIRYDKLEDDIKEVTLKLNWYDRNMEIKVPLQKDGAINEDK